MAILIVVAADVFVYVGGLEEAFESCKSVLTNNGLFIFSIELSDKQEHFMIRATGRYAHSTDYIAKLADRFAFETPSQKNIVLRMDSGNEIKGVIFNFARWND